MPEKNLPTLRDCSKLLGLGMSRAYWGSPTAGQSLLWERTQHKSLWQALVAPVPARLR